VFADDDLERDFLAARLRYKSRLDRQDGRFIRLSRPDFERDDGGELPRPGRGFSENKTAVLRDQAIEFDERRLRGGLAFLVGRFRGGDASKT